MKHLSSRQDPSLAEQLSELLSNLSSDEEWADATAILHLHGFYPMQAVKIVLAPELLKLLKALP